MGGREGEKERDAGGKWEGIFGTAKLTLSLSNFNDHVFGLSTLYSRHRE